MVDSLGKAKKIEISAIETFFITAENKPLEHLQRIDERINELNLALSKGVVISIKKFQHSYY